MLKPDHIPDEVWHTAMSTYHKAIRRRPGKAWQEAIAAALNAWPGAVHNGHWLLLPHTKIPLPTENSNGEG